MGSNEMFFRCAKENFGQDELNDIAFRLTGLVSV
jgi:hypothetical protein